MKKLHLIKDADRRLRAGHLWIYSNEIDSKLNSLKSYHAGELVQVVSFPGRVLGIAYINPHCLLSARMLTTDPSRVIDVDFFREKIAAALRKRDFLFAGPYYRLVYGESDGLPGMVIDRFDQVLVLQLNTAGMEALKPLIISVIVELFNPSCIYLRNDSSERKIEGLEISCETVYGELPERCIVKENGCNFQFSLSQSQKTGWFYDHRANRERLMHYCQNKRVLDLFSYMGAFSIPMAKAGAETVVAVDSSSSALAMLTENAILNNIDCITTQCSDVFSALEQFKLKQELFDVIVIDPPAFVKKKQDFHTGLSAYRKLNELALNLINNEGIIMTASCSMHVSANDLQNALRLAAISANKNVVILEQCQQAVDHPVHIAIPETRYLKGFICYVSN